jgi:hypothetical protein
MKKTHFKLPNHFLLAAALVVCLNAPKAAAEDFLYKHRKGDRYRILSTVREDVLVNNRLSHQAEMLNRIAVEVTDETEG